MVGTWLIYIVMASLGCLANYANKIDNGEKFSLKTLATRWIVALFAATLAGLWGESQHWDKIFIFMVCGLAGWMGVSAIKIAENLIKQRSGGNSSQTGDKQQ